MKLGLALRITFTAIAILLAGKGFSQERGSSQIKKPLIYQIGNSVHIHAEGPQPLLRALNALQEKFGWIVDYEDPECPADAEGATNPQALPHRRHSNARGSEEESFSVEFNVGPSPDSRPDENSVLTTVVNTYNQGSVGARFELRKENDNDKANNKQQVRFDVVGFDDRGQNDERSLPQPLLDLTITLTSGPRSAEQTLALICQKLSEKSKIPVAPAIGDVSRRAETVEVSGVDVPARMLLSRMLSSTAGRLCWRLLFDSTGRSYELTVTALAK